MRSPGLSRGSRATHALLFVGALLMVSPFVWQLSTSFKTFAESLQSPPTIFPLEPTLSGYQGAFASIPLLNMLGVSVIATMARTGVHVLVCALAAYAFARMRFPGSGVLFALCLSVMMVPYELLIIPHYEIVQGLGWINTIQALVVPKLFGPFGVFLLRQFFLTLPRDYEEAAALDGAGPLRTFLFIVLPMARNGLLALGILTVLASWQDLLWPLIVNSAPTRTPVSAGLATLRGEYYSNFPVLMAASIVAMAPVVVLFASMQKQFIEGIAVSGGKG